MRHLVEKVAEWKGIKGRQKDRAERARARVHRRCVAGGLAAHGAWFSNLALGLMSLFIQLQYQTFPFPAEEVPFEELLCWGVVSPWTGYSCLQT